MAIVSNPTFPRKLDASKAYVALLDARDDAAKFATLIADATPTDIINGGKGTCSMTLTLGNKNYTSATFAKYLLMYFYKNAKTVAPLVMDVITTDVLAQKTEAETEMGLNGLTTTPIILNPPAITSSLTPPNATTTQAWTYQIVADNISGPGINNVTYGMAEAPSWLQINATTGLVSGTPQQADLGTNTFDIKVTSNIGSDTKTVTVEVESHAKPVIVPGQSITTNTGTAATPYQVQAQYATIGQDGVTSVEWETDYTGTFSIDATTGIITGSGGSGSYTATMNVTLTNNFGSTTEAITINVVD